MSGYTNETIQDMIAALPGGKGTVYLDADIYVIYEPVILPDGVFLAGQGEAATQLFLAGNANCDIVRCIHDPAVWPTYYRYAGLAGMALHGNKAHNASGSGVVMSYVQHCYVRNVRIEKAAEWGIKLLRAYWCALRDVYLYRCANGVRVGCYDTAGLYTNGVPTDLYSNANTLDNIHIENEAQSGIGVHIASGRANVCLKCDTSACSTGLLVQNDGGSACQGNQLYGHFFESNTLDIEQHGANTSDTYVEHPTFAAGQHVHDETGTLYIL